MGIPPVLDTVSSSCSHNFILDRPVLSIVHDILAVYQTHDFTIFSVVDSCLIFPYYTWSVLKPYRTTRPDVSTNWRLNRPIIASGNALICGKYQYADGLTGRLGVGIPPVLDTVSSSCSHNFILDRPVLSIVHDILALY